MFKDNLANMALTIARTLSNPANDNPKEESELIKFDYTKEIQPLSLLSLRSASSW